MQTWIEVIIWTAALLSNTTYFFYEFCTIFCGKLWLKDAEEFLADILNKMEEECDRILCKQYDIEDKLERGKRNPVTSNFAFIIQSVITCKGF